MNPLQQLREYGQSVWLDYIRRDLVTNGELEQLIGRDGLAGMTSNPAIFEKAIGGSKDYAASLKDAQDRGMAPMAVYESLAIPDIQAAADAMRGVYDTSGGRDGYVSLEVSPFLAHSTQPTIEEARRLWKAVGRDNLMVKVPATPEGIPAIEQLLSEGININVTLLFSRDVYEQVARAYIRALAKYAASGGDVRRVASVASFFVSRIDAAVEKLASAAAGERKAKLESLASRIAIANAKLAYQVYLGLLETAEWRELAARGAHPQRLLWASTSTKNPSLPDVLYVDELIGQDTVNTIPPATYDAYRDHGKPRASLTEDVDGARAALAELESLGVSLDTITADLLRDGVRLFADAFDKLLNAVDRKCRPADLERVNRQARTLPEPLEQQVQVILDDWRAGGKVRRLWWRDASLWTGGDEARWLDWLDIVEKQLADAAHLREIAEDAREAGFSHAVLLGMGGSSLCPEVLAHTFGNATGYPELRVLDSTDPAQARAVEAAVNLDETLFIVASKSGSTLEPDVFMRYFYGRVPEGRQFIAITDPGSQLERTARELGFRRVVRGVPAIGGRYSALSNFGMTPAAILGIDPVDFLQTTDRMVAACSPASPASENPGVVLGAVLGAAAREGRDKLTLVASPGISGLGAWIEQLVAESTGKNGKAIIPVDLEPLGDPGVYGEDRLFVYLRLDSAPAPAQDAAVQALEQAGHPLVRISVPAAADLGQEFFRWEIATAVAGAILGIHPFDQPDVEASKIATRKLTEAYEQTGALPAEEPFTEAGGVLLFADRTNAAALRDLAEGDSLAAWLRAHLGRLAPGDYFALLAYVEMSAAHADTLARIRRRVRDAKRVATCAGFGPRFLHSTGQAYKGGPNTGVFLQITADDAADLAVPGRKYTFGVVKAAQARGDFAVLAERGRRALRVHLRGDVAAGLRTIEDAVL
ncbi:MAG: bifunctional transaldolase/phosoglucose isomerase [Bryobacterales bacterium]|nr:bifunctional transaldolase/phosoglucose isomerase [Bryobacterales bacterium]